VQKGQVEAQPAPKAQWEPMRLTPVGNLGTVMQAMNGSGTDTLGMMLPN
jgi:hypothetical protein